MNDKPDISKGKGSDWIIRDRELQLRKPMLMGILNVTPDSFSDGGEFIDPQKAVAHAHEMIDAGAEIIDIGGESTRPGSQPISSGEELDRVLPVIDALSKASDIIISIDTQKSAVAQAAMESGAHIINDVSGGQNDESIFQIVAESRAGYVMMHMQGTPDTMQNAPVYDDMIKDIDAYFSRQIDKALSIGVLKHQIVLDPGIGFGKTLADNLRLQAHLDEFHKHDLPLLLGASRKSFIGMIDNSKVEDRLGGSLAAVISAYLKGVQIFRVHDIAETAQTLNIFTAIQSHLD